MYIIWKDFTLHVWTVSCRFTRSELKYYWMSLCTGWHSQIGTMFWSEVEVLLISVWIILFLFVFFLMGTMLLCNSQWHFSICFAVSNFCHCSVSWGCRIYTNCFSAEGVRLPLAHECPGYDTKQSESEVPLMLELWGKRSTPSWPLLPGSLWPRVVAPNRVLSMSQIELNCILMLTWIIWNRIDYMYKIGFGIK